MHVDQGYLRNCTVEIDGQGTVSVEGKCRVTGESVKIEKIPLRGVMDWASGMFIQDALPNLDKDQREFFISGTSAKGWNLLFPKE